MVINKKSGVVVILVVAMFVGIIFSSVITATASGDENYNDYSNEYSQGDQPDSEDIPGMNRSEDRTRNKDS